MVEGNAFELSATNSILYRLLAFLLCIFDFNTKDFL